MMKRSSLVLESVGFFSISGSIRSTNVIIVCLLRVHRAISTFSNLFLSFLRSKITINEIHSSFMYSCILGVLFAYTRKSSYKYLLLYFINSKTIIIQLYYFNYDI